ncbi:MAG TPA: ABC transporter substrate-binding protein [Flavobacteriales bacterium]|nr:ABC transporter substrate-binding protein [Flavobacteriales bacterium]
MLARRNPLTTLVLWCTLAAVGGACNSTNYDASNVFRYNESANLTSLDPAFARTLEPMWVVDQLYDGLVELDSELNVRPLIAQSYHSEDEGTKWVFVLRDDVYFTAHPDVPGLAEGRRLTAADVVFSLNRLRDPELASSGRWILDALDASSEGGGLIARGADTVEFKLKQPFPPFLGLLATAYANVVAPEAVAYFGLDFRRNPVGSGPFKLAWWLEDVACVLHKNKAYWERDESGESIPYLDAVHISFASDMGAEFQGLLQGKFDFMSGLHAAYMEELINADGTLSEDYTETIRMETAAFLKTDYIGFYLEPNEGEWLPWHEKAVRRALSLATDRSGIARSLRRGTVVPAWGFVPPALIGQSKPRSIVFDVERAQSLMDSVASVHPRPWPEMVLSTTSDYTDLCAAIQYQWKAIGLEVRIDVVAPATHRDRVANGKVMAFRKSWLADYPDAENFLSLFRKMNLAPSGPNYTHYTNLEFDRRLDSALMEATASERAFQYETLNGMISDALPVIPLFHDQVTHFVRHEIEGWEINSVNRLDLRRVRKSAADL